MFVLSVTKPSIYNSDSSDKKPNGNEEGPEVILKKFFNDTPKDGSPLKGDINGDGKITLDDLKLVFNYVRKTGDNQDLTEAQKKAADLDGDGNIGEYDLSILSGIVHTQEFDTINADSKVRGDFNNDGKVDDTDYNDIITIEYANLGLVQDRTVNEKLFKAADLNKDGVLNGSDIEEFMTLLHGQNEPPHDPSPPRPPNANVLAGDINQDGKVNYNDTVFIGDYINGFIKQPLTEDQKQAGDLNHDGKVTVSDLLKLSQITFKNELEAIKPGSNLEGDLNNDGTVDSNDLRSMMTLRMSALEDPDVPSEWMSIADLNHDGHIDLKDLNALTYDIMKMEKPKIEFTFDAKVDPKYWMVSQLKGITNINEKYDKFNGDCGIASLLMAARMFGVVNGNAENAADEIISLREFLGVDNYDGSTLNVLAEGANQMGLDAKVVSGSIEELKAQLSAGKKVILGVDPSKYLPSYPGGHAILVTGFNGDNFTINDPGFQHSITVSAKALMLAMKAAGNHMAVIGKK